MRTSEREKKYLCISPGWRTPASLELAGRESRAIEEGGGGGGGDSVHALWLHCVHTRVGRCEHSGVALGLHLPVCVYVRGILRGPFNGDGDVQQLELRR